MNKYPDAHNPILDSDLPTEVIIEENHYRFDAIVLEHLSGGEPTERYWELDAGAFFELIAQESTQLQGDLIDIVRAKFSKELLLIIQANNEKLKTMISQSDQTILDPQYLELVSGN
ncbi:MAG: hypothetical protein ACRC78_04310 [Planktothrix sp.]